MTREERETRTVLVVLAIAAAVGLLPLRAALVAAGVVLVLAAVGSLVYTAVTFDRHVDDALRVIRGGGQR